MGSTDGAATTRAEQLDTARLGTALDRITRMLRRSALPGDLSAVAASTLYTLANLGPARITTLAEIEHVTQPAMTQLVRRLETAGLVARESDPDDGRAVVVAATEHGRALSLERRTARAATLAALIGDLEPGVADALADALPALERIAALGDERHRER